MKTKYALICAVGAIGLAGAAPASAAQDGQPRIADTTLKLEKAFNDQFLQGRIDRSALAAPITDVVQAMPEEARPRVQAHIEEVLQTGDKLASEMTPEQRARAVQPVSAETIGKTAQAQIAAWGWPGVGGWGGLGAFGFPGMYGYGTGLGWGGLGLGGWYW
jgi:hypothetical protein